MATTAEVETKWAEYKAAIVDRQAKQDKNAADVEKRNAAIAEETASHAAFIEALNVEHRLEDEHESLAIAHEPPAAPA